jgi:hypothetical protein
MQDTRTRYPSFKRWADSLPTGPTALAATPKHSAPQVAEPVAETTQRRRVAGDSMVTVVALNHIGKEFIGIAYFQQTHRALVTSTDARRSSHRTQRLVPATLTRFLLTDLAFSGDSVSRRPHNPRYTYPSRASCGRKADGSRKVIGPANLVSNRIRYGRRPRASFGPRAD